VVPPQDLTCPDPPGCPVRPALPLLDLQVVVLDAGVPLFRCYDGTWGYDETNPGYGDARFSPFDDATGARVPVLYAAQTPTAALLETVFHDVHPDADRVIYGVSLVEQLLAHLALSAPLTVVDLRDPELARLAITRGELVTTPAEHYPCTRRLARAVHGVRTGPAAGAQGLLWHSRQTELAGGAAEALVVFGDRYPRTRGSWPRRPPGSQNLWEGPGRERVDEIAEHLHAVVVDG
jgi:hypothetical protein